MPHASTDDVRVVGTTEVIAPSVLLRDIPVSDAAADTVTAARQVVRRIVHGEDPRLLVVVGPCSVHDPAAALDYARRLQAFAATVSDSLFIVMRTYFEKPRTTVGWKGLVNDPGLDGSFRINDGLHIARRLLLALNEMGMPVGTEFLDPISPQYIADLIAWGAIGARTTESQVHRELASGLSCPIGFKNGTDGSVQVAVDAVLAASHPHHFLGVTKAGGVAVIATAGNPDCHVILRGGRQPNYDAATIDDTAARMIKADVAPAIIVDLSHGNSSKQHAKQVDVGRELAARLEAGERRIVGVMIESFIEAGRQDAKPGKPLTYGQSITDACLGWPDTQALLQRLAEAARARRAPLAAH
ncbi:MAG: 3-deoxy-7-phosphoheptulonate synthase [Gammaproteobacteria bacterium]